MSTPSVPQFAARLELALMRSGILSAYLVADRMLDRDWQRISPRLVADLVDSESIGDTIRLVAEAIGVPMPSPWQAAKMAFDWLAYLVVTEQISAEVAAYARVTPSWRDRSGAPEAPEMPTSEPLLAMMYAVHSWMDDDDYLSPAERERLLLESSAELAAISQAVVSAPDWSFRDWPEAILVDPVLVAAVR